MNISFLANECPPLASKEVHKRPWQFLERYPELAFYLRGRPFLAKRMEAHYLRVQEFCTLYVAPQALDIERKQIEDPNYVPWELLQKACDYQLYSMAFPSVLGGSGQHIISVFIAYEMIATHCVAVANLLGVSGLAIGCVMSTFDPRAIANIAKLFADNEHKRIPTFLSTCVTEPGAGSDAEDADEFERANLHTTAKKVEGGYILNGNKVFISNGCLAQLHVVTVYNAAGKHRPEDLMLFLVEKDSPGLSIPRNEKKMGQRVCPASEVVFDNVFVADEMVCRTEQPTDTFAYAGIANVLGLTRAGVGGFATGVAENAYQTALEYVRKHDFLGQPMEQQQWVRVELAHLARRAQVARSTYLGALLAVCSYGIAEPVTRIPEVSWFGRLLQLPLLEKVPSWLLRTRGANSFFKKISKRQKDYARDTATAYADVAKVSCTELGMENCQRAISLMGKGGLRHEQGAEKLLRDIKLLQIYEGTNQVNMLDFVKRRVSRQFQDINQQ